jgi:hypothetical protein
MIAHWMSDPVHGTKTGYSKLAIKLAWSPRRPPRRPPPRSESPLPRPAAQAQAPPRGTSAVGAGWTPGPEGGTTPATHTIPDPTPTREEAGSPTSLAADTTAVEAAAEAAPATSTRARQLCAIRACFCIVVFIVFFNRVPKNPKKP